MLACVRERVVGVAGLPYVSVFLVQYYTLLIVVSIGLEEQYGTNLYLHI